MNERQPARFEVKCWHHACFLGLMVFGALLSRPRSCSRRRVLSGYHLTRVSEVCRSVNGRFHHCRAIPVVCLFHFFFNLVCSPNLFLGPTVPAGKDDLLSGGVAVKGNDNGRNKLTQPVPHPSVY